MILDADQAWPLWHDAPAEGAFVLDAPDAPPSQAVVKEVARPWLLGFAPARPNGRAMLILGGGGYTALMVGREGAAVARWLAGIGYHAYVLVHRFPNATHGVAAPLDDAREAVRFIRSQGTAPKGLGVVGLSSGGHLAACLAVQYPAEWTEPPTRYPEQATRPDLLVIGYAPISTNARGRTIIPDKAPLEPPEKQALYDRLQPDAQLLPDPPPTFIVYAANDAVVPVENARRLHRALEQSGSAAELHIFADAPHGFALDTLGLPVSAWRQMCEAWLRQVGFLE